MLRNIVSVYLFFAVILTLYFAVYVQSNSKSYYIKVFFASSLCVCVYLFGYLMELQSSSLEQMIFWNQIQYFGLPFYATLWCIFSLLYTKRVTVLSKTKLFLLFVIPVLTFFIRLTNPLHSFFYSSMIQQQAGSLTLLLLGKGVWYYVNSSYFILIFLITTAVFYSAYRKSTGNEHSRYRILLAASIIPYVGMFFILSVFLNLGIDYGAIVLPITLCLIMYAIFRYDFLEVKSLARETIFENSSDGMLLLDTKFYVTDYNKAARAFFDVLQADLQKRTLTDILSDRARLLHCFQSSEPHEYKLTQNNQDTYFEITSTPVKDTSGKTIGVLKTIRDITEKKKAQEELSRLAVVDELSGLNNRRRFMDLARDAFAHAQASNQILSVLMMDLDLFKRINDTYGHAAGDTVIREFGRLLSISFRKADVIGRLGGEEFAVVLTDMPLETALQIAESFREIVAKTTVSHDETEITLTVSIGVASLSGKTNRFEEILRHADEALYKAKSAGRNRTSVTSHEEY